MSARARGRILSYKNLGSRWITWRRTVTLLHDGSLWFARWTTFLKWMQSARSHDYVGQGIGTGGDWGANGLAFLPFPLRIVFIARPLSLTADFYSVSLHKSAYDILCAPAHKIVRNFSRPGLARPERYSQFFNFYSGYSAALRFSFFSSLSQPRTSPRRSRESRCVRSRIFSCRCIFSREDKRTYETIKVLRSRNSRRKMDVMPHARVLYDNIYKLIYFRALFLYKI